MGGQEDRGGEEHRYRQRPQVAFGDRPETVRNGPDVLLLGVQQDYPVDHRHAAERDDERIALPLRDRKPVEQAHGDDGGEDRAQGGQDTRGVAIHDPGGEASGQADHRADREIDAVRGDGERLSDAHDPECGGLAEHVEDVGRCEELRGKAPTNDHEGRKEEPHRVLPDERNGPSCGARRRDASRLRICRLAHSRPSHVTPVPHASAEQGR